MSIVKEMLGSARRTDIERWARSLAHGVAMPTGDTLCRVLGEYMFVVTLSDHSVAPHLVLNGYWETWVTMCLAKRVKPGWHCLDVGANFGYFTILLADLVGESGRVEAWEPSPALFRCLEPTVALSGFGARVAIVACAAGTEIGPETRYLVRRGHDYASATIRTQYVATSRHAQEPVKERRLESVTALERVDFVKLDVEGMEPEAWASLGEKLPQAALIEWTPTRYAEPRAFLDTLRAQRYSIGRVDPQGDVIPAGDELLEAQGSEMLWIERR